MTPLEFFTVVGAFFVLIFCLAWFIAEWRG
jgi:hypothetical protein